ncbi:T-cell-specific guanine nucleotide triphosphate-binding protein 1-like [Enhydra lutris kenyoni]|uniref:T-cell-specific guanine nucleotide triphosphate-binding protein 1-like n=1 Tax=Enhydra lutris kenyoni TaxID=391180 RepID=A0A2Y9KSE4_ENHLU|nr:T-cell-specific guanine nucleotide triphosphate-binding protein 1-like [Enhydra lutris kenyoni]XP_022376896.1 T-cell-specific guanine nucleotide triphosphate-binding protein 1-like [Enhydra lutris kenyoni]XP_022376897.1 T-cell-specific guanine nucleotide triphosphate-binding protein 1-like [Enhydra lutris kenyoni]XP_022376898.1 T-cell-specific guanine nucleotide triphosphate-binding protein 1-like [Enhydra lutris kenyoni]
MGQSSSSSSTPSPIEGGDLISSFDKFFKDFKLESEMLSQEAITLIQSHLEKGDLQRAVSAINDALRDIDNAPLNIAVIGESGAGKSSFINALLGVKQDDENAAHTGPVEITLERAKYEYKKFPNVMLWDLPGLETTLLPRHEYLQKMKFGQYDIFIIVSAVRLKMNDLDLAVAIRKMKKHFYFVRTKVDLDLNNLRTCKPSTFNRDEILQRIRNDYVTHLENVNMGDTQIFLVSSLELSDYDFQHLETTLLRELPTHKHQKQHIFMQYLSTVAEAAIDQRRDSLRQKVWLDALKARVLATIPFMSSIIDIDVVKLEETLSFYRSHFGLDDASLEIIAKHLNVSIGKLKTNLRSPHLLSVEKDEEALEKKLLTYVEKSRAEFSGGLIATTMYVQNIFYLKIYFLECVANDAKVLLREENFKDVVGSGQASLLQHVRNDNGKSEATSC